ncbi:protein-glutamate methylesterase/protein-glutamine glutaminase [Sphingomonas mollis]|uniref:Protein-glutamate methylesterase/protein-glutamine glutaminase n=1 Tax=Sphingomonas mollis TaxID=2795726 RepID=A0ABS0XQ06_9SPHN|nr:chemotaxis response regulator protein-glutamate methylesterase [Sphingomonas sp. BT553]MBJ6122122.1 chemotaxis response regulator protein-glutamate methylesterase [Sphingomonas sp. BT553]
MTPIRALVVDDSAAIRAVLTRILSVDPEIEVVGQAPEPNTARQMIKDLEPDVITLDVEMPGMDGLSFLERIMRLRPMPVVMCSTLTAHGAAVTIEALRLGAVDCIAKPKGSAEELARNGALLRATVKAAARSAVRPSRSARPPVVATTTGKAREDAVIAIGSSTGGVEALFALLGAMPVDCPPILIVQHMPGAFTGSFADRLDRECRIHVQEARDGMTLAMGNAYIAPGGEQHMELVGAAGSSIRVRPGELTSGHRPSVDVLFRSVATRRGPAAVGAILTGMGSDGAEGLLAMRRAGARTFGQSRESCVVYGMPRAAMELGAVDKEMTLSAMPEAILAACGMRQARVGA